MTASPMKKRVAMIGIDAGDADFIRAHAEHLPALAGFLREGETMPLMADHLPGSVWPSFATKSKPGVHGRYHHMQWDHRRTRMQRLRGDWLSTEPFWYGLAHAGRRVLTIDVPMMTPRAIEGVTEVSNWGSHDLLGPFWASDATLKKMISRRFGKRHPMGFEIPVAKTPAQLDRMTAELVEGADRKAKLVKWLMQETEWDLMIAVFGECHRGGHLLWPDPAGGAGDPAHPEALLDVYRAVDAAVAEVVAELDLSNTTVVLFAVHGMGPNTSQAHFVPPVMDRINALFAGEVARHSRPRRGQAGFVRRLREQLPARLQHGVALAVPVWVRDWVIAREIAGGIDWKRTLGFALRGDLGGYVRLNLAGRDAKGEHAPGSERVERYRSFVREAFLELTIGDTGDPLVHAVSFPQVDLPGPRSDYLPDILIEWPESLGPVSHVRSERLGDFHAELATGRGGNHRFTGFASVIQAGTPVAGTRPRHIAELGDFVEALM